MNADPTSEHDIPSPASPPDPDDDEGRPSPEFHKLLEDFERGRKSEARSTVEVSVGIKVRARLISIGDEQSLVDFGGRSEGAVETRLLKDESGAMKHAIGDELDLFVLRAEDEVLLAPTIRADADAAMSQLREAHRNGVPVTGRVTGRNAGGLEVDFTGARGFCPVSQIESGFCADPSVHVGHTLDFLVTGFRDGRGGVVVSRRALLKREEEENARKLLATLKPGDEVEARVARLEPFGAFVDLGGVDGLVHVSEIRHERVGHPSEALAVGERVRARVLRIEPGKDGRTRIALSIKAAAPDPWLDVERMFAKGARVTGPVVRLTEFGAFVNLAPGIDGLVHVSEAAAHPVAHVKDVLATGQSIEAVVTNVDPQKKRISLSIREAISAASPAPPARKPATGDRVEGFVSGIKPFGLFVDLPAYGLRTRGLVPREETGAARDADLSKRFSIGDALEVEVLESRDDRIRLSLRRERAASEPASPARESAPAAAPPPAEVELTTMAIALRKALEKAKEKEGPQ